MTDSPRIRLCERCWHPVAAGTVFRVFRHPDPPIAETLDEPTAERFSFRHLEDDPACSGAQLAETDAESDARADAERAA